MSGWLASRPAIAGACKPPQYVAERLEFALIAARRGGQAVALTGVPDHLYARSDPYIGLNVVDLGLLRLVAATEPLPRSTGRYLGRQRRRASLICAVRVFRAPAVPGRYVPDHGSTDIPLHDVPWTTLWPADVPGVVEFSPDRGLLRLRIERPEDPLELDYRLTRATFACDVTADGDPGALIMVGLGLLWRRRRAEGPTTRCPYS